MKHKNKQKRDNEVSNENTEDPNPKKWYESLWKWIRIRTRLTDWLIVLCSSAIAVVGFLQWNTLDLQRKQFVATERAMVMFSQFSIQGSDNINNTHKGGVVINPVWTNSGNTQTRNLRIYTAPIIRSEKSIGENYNFSIPDIKFLPSVLGAKGTTSGDTNIITADDLKKIKDSKIIITIWGEVTYNDIFPNTPLHVTKFCQETTGIGWVNPQKLWEKGNLGFRVCASHNCTDEECDNK
jgi:hypothetical protein